MKLLLFGSLIFVPSLLQAEVAVQGSPTETKAFLLKHEARVTLRGSASTLVEASDVTITIRLSAEGPTSTAAVGLAEQKAKDLITKLDTGGIPRGQLKVPKFTTITPKYGNSDQPTGHSASMSIAAELHDQKQYLDLIAVTDKIPGTTIAGLQYNHSQLANLHRTVLANACKRVMARKEVYEQALGVILRPVSFTEEEGSERPDFSDASRFGQIPVKASVSVTFDVLASAAAGASPGQQILPTELKQKTEAPKELE